VQMTMPATGTAFIAAARVHAERLALHDAELVVFPAMPGPLRNGYDHDEVLAGMSSIAADAGLMVVFTVNEGAAASGERAMYLVGPRGVMAKYQQTHKPDDPRFASMPLGVEPCPVINTSMGKLGLIHAAEIYVPEIARSLMLRGAEILIIAAHDAMYPLRNIARSRADENRVFVACAGTPTARSGALIVDPSGRIIAEALEGRELSVSATVNRALSHLKAMAPGTDVVRDRQPATYSAIIRSGAAVHA